MTPVEWSLPAVHDVIAGAVPERDMVVWKSKRLTYGAAVARTKGFAAFLTARGVGAASRAGDTRALGVGSGSGRARAVRTVPSTSKPCSAAFGPVRFPSTSTSTTGLRRSAICSASSNPSSSCTTVDWVRWLPRHCRIRRSCSSMSTTTPGWRRFPVARTSRTRAVPTSTLDDTSGAVARRPLHGLHGRYDRPPQGRAVASGRCVRRGDGRIRRDDRGVVACHCARGRRRRRFAAPPLMHGAAQWTAFGGMHMGATIVIHDDSQPFDVADDRGDGARAKRCR